MAAAIGAIALYGRRKQIKASLSADETLYRTLAETAQDSIFIVDRDSRIAYINTFGARQLSTVPEAVMGKYIHELFPPEVSGALEETVQGVFNSGVPYAEEYRMRFPHADIWMDTSLAPIRRQGRVEAVLGMSRDTTERKAVETALKYNEERFRAIADTANDAIISIDSSGKIVFWNRAAESLFGYSAAEILGLDVELIMPAEYRSAHQEGLAQYIKTEGPAKVIGKTVEFSGLRKDRSEFPLELSVAAWKIKEEKFFTGIVRDITERRQADETREETGRLNAALNDIHAAIASTLNLDEIMQRVATGGAGAINAESSAIILREADRWVLRYVHNLPPHFVGTELPEETAKPTVTAIRDNQPVVIDDVNGDARIDPGITAMFKLRSLMAVPLSVKGALVGGLLLCHHSAAVPFHPSQVEFARKLATTVGLAIENARLYEKQRNIADTLQESLLETPRRIDGVNFDYYYSAATELSRVGGDFYDIFALDRGRVGIIVGDVSGKGLPAAGLTSLVKSTIKAYAYENDSTAWVMAMTNEVVTRAVSKTTFVTVFFGILNINTGLLRYCSAGHPPPIIKAGPEAMLLTTRSPAIGVFADFQFFENRQKLAQDDILVIYTDGITEARRDSDFFGEDRLLSLIGELEPRNTGEVSHLIFNHIVDFTNGALADDVALVAISLTNKARLRAVA
ncbi:MAG: PAS domain S-box protein [Actinomycetota bacterium]|nr:PAS domain S-box protein [Actinomycetota bacterium]